MRPTTPLELLASFEREDRSSASTKAKPSVHPLNSNDMRDQVRARLRKIKLTATFCAFNLRGLKDRDELWVSLCETKKQASVALQLGETLIRPRPLKNLNRHVDRFYTQYGNLSCTLGQVFLIMAPDLAARAETAF